MKRTTLQLVFALVFAVFSIDSSGTESLSLTFQSQGSTEQIPATLIKPTGPGPFPAVVIMHDCSGLGSRASGAPMRWAQELVAQGYVALVPDSFTPRSFTDGVCTLPRDRTMIANGYIRAADAYGALTALRKLPYVDGKHIGIIGGSHGGWSTLAAMYAPMQQNDPLAEAKHNGFTAAVVLYPSCASRYGAWSTVRQYKTYGPVVSHAGVYKAIAPVLILIGEKDDWTPAEDCRQMVEVSRAAGFPLQIIIYPNAHHSFDSDYPIRYIASRTNPSSVTGKGATTGGNITAWSDAKKQVKIFFDQYLKQ